MKNENDEKIKHYSNHWIYLYKKELVVKIKPNTKNKERVYYGFLREDEDLTDVRVSVYEELRENPKYPNCYFYRGSTYIDKEDCEIIDQWLVVKKPVVN